MPRLSPYALAAALLGLGPLLAASTCTKSSLSDAGVDVPSYPRCHYNPDASWSCAPPTCAAQPPPVVRPSVDGMMLVPAGCFVMGCDPNVDPTCAGDEQPAHAVEVSAFYIDQNEATEGDYNACHRAGVCAYPSVNGDPLMPATGIAYDDARAYCQSRGKRLPTEAEWEYAARGTDGRIYPWGNTPPDCSLAAVDSCPLHHVGALPAGASPFGVLDMAGNTSEWVADLSEAYCCPSDPASSPNSWYQTVYIERGGVTAHDARTTARFSTGPSYAIGGRRRRGVRCARSVGESIDGGLPPAPCAVTTCPGQITCTYPQQSNRRETVSTCCHGYLTSVQVPLASASCWENFGNFCAADPGRIADLGDPDQAVCLATGAITCAWPSGTIACPALWITHSSDGHRIYTNGCCYTGGVAGAAPECGVSANPGCGPPQPGDQAAP